MKFIHLSETDHYFNQCMALYSDTFNYEVREPIEVFDASFNLKRKDEQRYHFIVALEGEDLVGFIAFHLEVTYRIGYIVYLVVNPKYRGKQVARQLMSEAEEVMVKYCEHNGTTLEHIMLECEKDENGFSPLDTFYKKFGYERSQFNYHQPGLHNDAPVPMNLYIKSENPSNIKAAIEHIYRIKYVYCNHIDTQIVDALIEQL